MYFLLIRSVGEQTEKRGKSRTAEETRASQSRHLQSAKLEGPGEKENTKL